MLSLAEPHLKYQQQSKRKNAQDSIGFGILKKWKCDSCATKQHLGMENHGKHNTCTSIHLTQGD